MVNKYFAALVCLLSMAWGIWLGRMSPDRDHFTLQTFEDGSFILFEHGSRIGSGCFDGEICVDEAPFGESQITIYKEP
jgi:hypothetical protein